MYVLPTEASCTAVLTSKPQPHVIQMFVNVARWPGICMFPALPSLTKGAAQFNDSTLEAADMTVSTSVALHTHRAHNKKRKHFYNHCKHMLCKYQRVGSTDGVDMRIV